MSLSASVCFILSLSKSVEGHNFTLLSKEKPYPSKPPKYLPKHSKHGSSGRK